MRSVRMLVRSRDHVIGLLSFRFSSILFVAIILQELLQLVIVIILSVEELVLWRGSSNGHDVTNVLVCLLSYTLSSLRYDLSVGGFE